MKSVCALREFETEETCKQQCEFYGGEHVCEAEYSISFCAYQQKERKILNVTKDMSIPNF